MIYNAKESFSHYYEKKKNSLGLFDSIFYQDKHCVLSERFLSYTLYTKNGSIRKNYITKYIK